MPGPYGTLGEEESEERYGNSPPKHELDTSDLLDTDDGWYGLVHANRPTDQNQNPEFLTADIIKSDGGAIYPFQGRLIANSTRLGNPAPTWNEEIKKCVNLV